MTTKNVNWRDVLAKWMGREGVVREEHDRHYLNQQWHDHQSGPRSQWYGLPTTLFDASGSIPHEQIDEFLGSS